MFWFKDEITRRKEKEEYEKLMEEVKNKEKEKSKTEDSLELPPWLRNK